MTGGYWPLKMLYRKMPSLNMEKLKTKPLAGFVL